MASNEQAYRQALQKWDTLRDEGSFSVPAAVGSTAVLLPFNHLHRDTEDLPGQNFTDVRAAVYTLAAQMMAEGQDVEVGIDASVEDFARVLTDPTISDVMIVGHGCLASFEIDAPAHKNRLDWKDIGFYTNHLKLGRITQLACGTLPRPFNVPFGLFAASKHSDVWAATGLRIVPADFWGPENHIAPVTDRTRLTYEHIKELFPQRQLIVTPEAQLVLGGLGGALAERLAALQPPAETKD